MESKTVKRKGQDDLVPKIIHVWEALLKFWDLEGTFGISDPEEIKPQGNICINCGENFELWSQDGTLQRMCSL